MLSHLNKRNWKKFCQFYKDHSYYYSAMQWVEKKEIENAIWRGQLKEFIDEAVAKRTSDLLCRRSLGITRKRLPKMTFLHKKWRLLMLYKMLDPPTSWKRSRDDPLVVTMPIGQCIVKCILIDTGSPLTFYSRKLLSGHSMRLDHIICHSFGWIYSANC